MIGTLIVTENGDRNLTSKVAVFNQTVDANNHRLVTLDIKIGDGTKNRNTTATLYEYTVTIGSQVQQPAPQAVAFGTDVRAGNQGTFLVPANTALKVEIKSNNASDTDVDVTVSCYDVGPPVVSGSVSDGTPAADTFTASSDLSNTDDRYNKFLLVFTTGSLLGQSRPVSNYAGTLRSFDFDDPFPAAPANGDKFILISYAGS